MKRSVHPPARLDDEVGLPVTGPRWRLGSIPPGSGLREVDAELELAARPFLDDGYRSTARAGDGVQLTRSRRTSIPGRVLSAIGWLRSALLGFLSPPSLTPGWTATDPIYLWMDASGDIWAARELVLGPVEDRA